VPYLGRRNLIINGAMQVAQRGTDVTWTSGSTFRTLDRWSHDWSLNGSMQSQQVTDAPDGFDFSLKCTVVTPSTDGMVGVTEYFTLRQGIEGYLTTPLAYGTSSAQKMTLSFWVKASTAATYAAGFRATLAGTTHGNFRTFTINTANTWEKKVLTFNPHTTLDFSNRTNAKGMGLHIALTCSDNIADTTDDGNWDTGNFIGMNSGDGTIGNFAALSAGETFQITGVQLEVGSVATPFEHRSYGEELALCQRYFCKSFNDTTTPANVSNNSVVSHLIPYNGNDGWTNSIYFPVRMRAAPSITLYSTEDEVSLGNKWQFYDGTWKDVTGNNSPAFISQTDFFISMTASGQFTAFVPRLCKGHYTADAEL